MRGWLVVIVIVSACRAQGSPSGIEPHRDVELERAIAILEQVVTLAPTPQAIVLLATAYERAVPPPPTLLDDVADREARLAARDRGEPHVDDALRRQAVIETAAGLQRNFELLHRGTVRVPH